VHPAGPVDRLAGRLLVVPVVQHHHVAAGAQLTGLAARHDLSVVGVGDLDFDVGMDAADGRHALVDGSSVPVWNKTGVVPSRITPLATGRHAPA
jgi:hypothetical protein